MYYFFFHLTYFSLYAGPGIAMSGRPVIGEENIGPGRLSRVKDTLWLFQIQCTVVSSFLLFSPGSKLDATREAAWGPLKEIKMAITKYDLKWFSTLCGAKRSLKPETTARIKKQKLASVEAQLLFLHNKTGHTSVGKLIDSVEQLGDIEDGFYSKTSSCLTRSKGLPVFKHHGEMSTPLSATQPIFFINSFSMLHMGAMV